MGELKTKTRILVTHAIDFLHLADQIIVFKKGSVFLDGTFDELKDNSYLVKILKIHNSH
jgi:ABC-type multidrug transport system fused ATPase/permease subunit